MKRVIWLSRHPMGADQLADLAAVLGCKAEELQVTSENVTWAASENAAADRSANEAEWLRVLKDADVVTGVFPPVAMETLAAARHRGEWTKAMLAFDVPVPPATVPAEIERDALDEYAYGRTVLSPVSRQSKAVRADGTATIEFHHVRWARV